MSTSPEPTRESILSTAAARRKNLPRRLGTSFPQSSSHGKPSPAPERRSFPNRGMVGMLRIMGDEDEEKIRITLSNVYQGKWRY